MTQVKLDPARLVQDGDDLYRIAQSIDSAISTLTSRLSSSAGMAGDDDSAEEFCQGGEGYDAVSGPTVDAVRSLSNGLRLVDSAMSNTARAYDGAQKPGAGLSAASARPASSTPYIDHRHTKVPSALGPGWPGPLGEFQEFLEWGLHQLGVVIPTGDEDKLQSAADAWGDFAQSLRTAKSDTSHSMSNLGSMHIPQKQAMQGCRDGLASSLLQLSESADGMKTWIRDFRTQLRQTREELGWFLKQMAIELAADLAIGGLLSIVTVGIGALATAAKATATVIRWCQKIATLIMRLKSFLQGLRGVQGILVRGALHAAKEGVQAGLASSIATVSVNAARHDDKDYTPQDVGLAFVTAFAGGAVAAPVSRALGGTGGAGLKNALRETAGESVGGAVDGLASALVETGMTGQEFNPISGMVFGAILAGGVSAAGHGIKAARPGSTGAGSGGATRPDGVQAPTPAGAGSGASSSHGSGSSSSRPDGSSIPTAAAGGAAASTASGGSGVSVHSDAPAAAGSGGGGGTAAGSGSVDVSGSSAPDAPASLGSGSDVSSSPVAVDVSTGADGASTPGGTDVSSTPGGTDVSSTPGGTDVSSTPNGTDVSSTPGGIDVSATPHGADVSSTPGGTEVSATPHGADVSSTPGGTEVSAAPHGTDVSSTPGGTDVSSTPNGTDVSSTPGGTDVSSTPGGTDVSSTPTGADASPAGTADAPSPTATDAPSGHSSTGDSSSSGDAPSSPVAVANGDAAVDLSSIQDISSSLGDVSSSMSDVSSSIQADAAAYAADAAHAADASAADASAADASAADVTSADAGSLSVDAAPAAHVEAPTAASIDGVAAEISADATAHSDTPANADPAASGAEAGDGGLADFDPEHVAAGGGAAAVAAMGLGLAGKPSFLPSHLGGGSIAPKPAGTGSSTSTSPASTGAGGTPHADGSTGVPGDGSTPTTPGDGNPTSPDGSDAGGTDANGTDANGADGTDAGKAEAEPKPHATTEFTLAEADAGRGEINPNYDPTDPRNGYATNCGHTTANYFDFLNGNPATEAGTGTLSVAQMEARTGLPQTTATPAQIDATLRNLGAGSHVVVGLDRAPKLVNGEWKPVDGHWMTALFDGERVWAIDSQTNKRTEWPPNEPNAVNWDISAHPEHIVNPDGSNVYDAPAPDANGTGTSGTDASGTGTSGTGTSSTDATGTGANGDAAGQKTSAVDADRSGRSHWAGGATIVDGSHASDGSDGAGLTYNGYDIPELTPEARHELDALAAQPDSPIVRNEDGSYSLKDPVKVEAFNLKNTAHDWAEFQRQVGLQQQGLNQLTIAEWRHNVDFYQDHGRVAKSEQDAANAALGNAGVPMQGRAVLHGPDQVAGGRADRFDGAGSFGINSSLGNQWRHRIDAFADRVDVSAFGIDSKLLAHVRLNVELGAVNVRDGGHVASQSTLASAKPVLGSPAGSSTATSTADATSTAPDASAQPQRAGTAPDASAQPQRAGAAPDASAQQSTGTAHDATLADGSTHRVAYGPASLAGADGVHFRDALNDLVASGADTTGGSGPTVRNFDELADLVDRPIAELSRTELDLVIHLRDSLPSPHDAHLVQKTIQPDQAQAIIDAANGDPNAKPLHDVGGFVARPADMGGLTTPEIFDTLGLNYPGTPFPNAIANGQPFFDIVYESPNAVTPEVADLAARWMQSNLPSSIWGVPAGQRADAIRDYWNGLDIRQREAFEAATPGLEYQLSNALDPSNPFRGNGFSGAGRSFVPEATYAYGHATALPDGAEFWRTLPDGRREFVGVLRRPTNGSPATWVLAASGSSSTP